MRNRSLVGEGIDFDGRRNRLASMTERQWKQGRRLIADTDCLSAYDVVHYMYKRVRRTIDAYIRLFFSEE